MTKLVFERSMPGRRCDLLPASDVPEAKLESKFRRGAAAHLPELAEIDVARHYSALEKRVHGVNDGFYPLGSCTMKYNPAVNEDMASLPGFIGVHPLQHVSLAQGCLEVLYRAGEILKELTGMDGMTFQPAAGAHGEFCGLLFIKAYHRDRGDNLRTKIIVPDSAHGTNPASAVMAGFTVVNIPSASDGCVDLDALRAAVGPDTAGLMLTNPNTLGVFDRNILEITKIVHEAGGLCYYDGANMNAVMGVSRPGDMGFDVVHLNLHKTFSTPHGGGGPGAGAVGVKKLLLPFMPMDQVVKTEAGFALETAEKSFGRVKAYCGNFLVVVKALTYMLSLGGEGLRDASVNAVLNANYLKAKLAPYAKVATDGHCMHEFVLSLEELKAETGVSAMDIAKGMIDYGMHPPTMYFPLIVHEALMFEPTETEPMEVLDEAAKVVIGLIEKARTDPEALHAAPQKAVIKRPDEVMAARSPVLRYAF